MCRYRDSCASLMDSKTSEQTWTVSICYTFRKLHCILSFFRALSVSLIFVSFLSFETSFLLLRHFHESPIEFEFMYFERSPFSKHALVQRTSRRAAEGFFCRVFKMCYEGLTAYDYDAWIPFYSPDFVDSLASL